MNNVSPECFYGKKLLFKASHEDFWDHMD
jgi:hypothetical protein